MSESITAINPNTGRILGRVPVYDETQVRAAVARARATAGRLDLFRVAASGAVALFAAAG